MSDLQRIIFAVSFALLFSLIPTSIVAAFAYESHTRRPRLELWVDRAAILGIVGAVGLVGMWLWSFFD